MSIFNKISFHLTKVIRMTRYRVKYGKTPWAEIEAVRIPVYMHYGYSVLRFIDNREYESCEIAIVKKTLHLEDIVMELGTGIGFVSAYCAKKIGSEKVTTYEANPMLIPLIEQTYKLNNVRPNSINAMLGKEGGTNIFYRQAENFLASSSSSFKEKVTDNFSVPVLSLNEEIKSKQPSYLVMDIEGGEYEIFETIDFQSIKKIQFELHPGVLTKEEIEFIFRKLERNGFVRSSLFNFENNFFYEKK